MDKNSKIYIAGHLGLVGARLVKKLEEDGFVNIIVRTHAELDLTRQTDVEAFFEEEKPDYVFLAAAKTGGVQARLDVPADMLVDNAAITLNIMRAALRYNTQKLLYIASGLVYSDRAEQPLKTDSIGLYGQGPANEPYALAKIIGIRLCQYMRQQYNKNFISCIPCNTYGTVREGDSQFIPATIMKFAKNSGEVVIWGDGTPTREFLHVDDLAGALIFLMKYYNDGEPVNIGTNEEIPIFAVVNIIKRISRFCGEVKYDITKPDGAGRLFMDSTVLADLGWRPKISLAAGLQMEYDKYKESLNAD